MLRNIRRASLAIVLAVALAITLVAVFAQDAALSFGVREPAWSPDGKRLAISYLDRLYTMTPDGRQATPVTTVAAGAEREPAWSPDGKTIVFAADAGSGFDLYTVASNGGAALRATSLEGDERWPSWTRDGRIVFAHLPETAVLGGTSNEVAPTLQWDLYIVTPGQAAPSRIANTSDDEKEPRVSPDGTRIAFISNRDNEDAADDVWVMVVPPVGGVRLPPSREASAADPGKEAFRTTDDGRRITSTGPIATEAPVRITRTRDPERAPVWSPSGDRLAYYAVREGVGSIWVSTVDPPKGSDPDVTAKVARRPAPDAVLVSRHGGTPAWSPDGATLVIAELPDPEPGYNGNPARVTSDPPPLFGLARAFQLWSVPAPLPVDGALRLLPVSASATSAQYVAAFDRVWETLRRLYYSTGASASTWESLKQTLRPRAAAARDDRGAEAVVDELVAKQPLIKPAVSSPRAVIVSGHPLASEAGRLALEKGGNVVDAAIAASFALGVVEPDASGIGGDGMAILHLRNMPEPTVIDYKDQTPIHATLDNPRIMRQGRLVADGAAAANIPGTLAGLDYLYRRYGSGKVAWADLIAPAIRYADEGFVLDEALPTTIAAGRRVLEKYPAARRLFLPGGRVPRPGDRFVNKDYAATLRAIAADGAATFYRGAIARRIAADLTANGGIIGYDDLAQYRVIERKPLAGRYRAHRVFSVPPPVASGAGLIETLQILAHYPAASGASLSKDADFLHYLIESWKARDPMRRAADPERWTVDLGDHLSEAHASMLFKRIDRAKAGKLWTPEAEQNDEAETTGLRIGRGTTAFTVADADGNMIAVTQTLSTWGGTFYVSDGLGFLYNNHLRSTGTTSGAYGQLLPLVRSSTASVPTLVFSEQGSALTPFMALGAAGNAWIQGSIYSIIANVIDSGMGMQQAVEAPRFLVVRDPADPTSRTARTQIEDRIPRDLLENLMRRGHVFHKIGRKGEVRYGYASAVMVDVANKTVYGGADPRRSHAAVGF